MTRNQARHAAGRPSIPMGGGNNQARSASSDSDTAQSASIAEGVVGGLIDAIDWDFS